MTRVAEETGWAVRFVVEERVAGDSVFKSVLNKRTKIRIKFGPFSFSAFLVPSI